MTTDTHASSVSPYRMKLRAMLGNRRWIAENIDDLMEQYPSKWIVVAEKTVLGADVTAEGAIAACDKDIDEIESIVLMVPDLVPQPI